MEFINTSLPTQQRRIRHLRSVAARNIKANGDGDISTLRLFFSLHTSSGAQAFYTSEVITGSVNPTWKTFSLEHLVLEEINTSKTTVILRVWRKRESDAQLVLDWTVSLSGLRYFGDKLQKEISFRPNTLLFGMFGGFYIAPDPKDTPITRKPSDFELSVDRTLVRKSYSASTTDRIQTIQRVIKQTELSGRKTRKDIEAILSHSQLKQQKKSALESVAMRVAMLQSDLEWRTNRLRTEKDKYENLQTNNIRRERDQQDKANKLRNDRARLREKKKSYFNVREDLIKTGAQLVMRRKQLISELTLIYPIVDNANGDFNILGIVLPNAEKLQGCSETQLEVALGYTCHLVQMIGQFLDMPLRYPMMHRGSKSVIHDHILEKLADKEREFPLFSKGRERFQFDYGVYLINKNIAQLRYYCGLGTTDLRLTLANLKTLLQLRLGVKFDHLETMRHASLQPSGSSKNRNIVSPQSKPSTSSASSSINSSSRYRTEKDAVNSTALSDKAKRRANENESVVETESRRHFHDDRRLGQYYLDSSLNSTDTLDKSGIATPAKRLQEEDDLFHKGSPDSFFNIPIRSEDVPDSEVIKDIDNKEKQNDGIETAQEADVSVHSTTNIPATNKNTSIGNNSPFVTITGSNDTSQNSPFHNIEIDNETKKESESNLHTLQAQVNIDYDANSMNDTSPRPHKNRASCDDRSSESHEVSPPPLSTLDQLTKEKLLGSIANYDEIDVSSSEDSANAAYGQQFKFLRDRTTLHSLMSDNRAIDEHSLSDENEGVFNNDSVVKKEKKGNEIDNAICKNGITKSSNGEQHKSSIDNDKKNSDKNRDKCSHKNSTNSEESVPNTSCNTPDTESQSAEAVFSSHDSCAMCNSEGDQRDSDNTQSQGQSEPIDVAVRKPCYAHQTSDESLIDSSPTFRIQTKAS